MTKAIFAVIGLFGAMVVITAGVTYETWAALTIMGWAIKAPWQSVTGPTSFWSLVMLNVAVSLIMRQGKHTTDDRTPLQMLKDTLEFYVAIPTTGLVMMWMIKEVML